MKHHLPRYFYVVATDPSVEWRCDMLTIRATSKYEAKQIARARLAEHRRDHWDLRFI